jgi:hypothetical protein
MTTNKYWMEFAGEFIPNHEAMVAFLLERGILHVNGRKYVEIDNSIAEETLVLFLNCNDTFFWATSDAEAVKYDELPGLFKMVENNPKWGDTQWVAIKRNMKPQKPLVDMMKSSGGWNDTMENLPANPTDSDFLETNKI